MREEYKKITELQIENTRIKRDILAMVKKYPNNMELGKYIRRYSYQFDTTNEDQLCFFEEY